MQVRFWSVARALLCVERALLSVDRFLLCVFRALLPVDGVVWNVRRALLTTYIFIHSYYSWKSLSK